MRLCSQNETMLPAVEVTSEVEEDEWSSHYHSSSLDEWWEVHLFSYLLLRPASSMSRLTSSHLSRGDDRLTAKTTTPELAAAVPHVSCSKQEVSKERAPRSPSQSMFTCSAEAFQRLEMSNTNVFLLVWAGFDCGLRRLAVFTVIIMLLHYNQSVFLHEQYSIHPCICFKHLHPNTSFIIFIFLSS